MILARICLPKIFFQNLGFLCSYIQNSKLHTFVFILASLRNKKQTNLWGIILARICLLKIFFQNLGFLCNYIQNSIAAHSCMYFSFSQKQETNRSMGYYSYQNLLSKNIFPKSELVVKMYIKFKLHALDLFWLLSGITNK